MRDTHENHGATLIETPFVSVIVPAFNAAETLPSCLSALFDQQYPHARYEVIVVDDGSADLTATIARQIGAHVVAQPHNQGRSAARNAGAAAANGDILLFTDADCRPMHNWIVEMVRPFVADAAVVGVKGAYLCAQQSIVARFTQLELEDKYDEMARHRQISFIDTYSAGYRKDIFLTSGGFDETLNYSLLEDQDFSFRLAADGHKMMFAPQARVYHQHVTRVGRYYWRKWQIGRWKTVILRRFPERQANDSRTPLTLKIQFGLALLLFPLGPMALFIRPIRWLLGGMSLLFAATGGPFLRKTLQRDPRLLPFVLPLLIWRALGLAHGYLNGMFRLRHVE